LGGGKQQRKPHGNLAPNGESEKEAHPLYRAQKRSAGVKQKVNKKQMAEITPTKGGREKLNQT